MAGPYTVVPQAYAGARVVDGAGNTVCTVENGGTLHRNPPAERIALALTVLDGLPS